MQVGKANDLFRALWKAASPAASRLSSGMTGSRRIALLDSLAS